MANLTDQQRNLLQIVNQLNQSLLVGNQTDQTGQTNQAPVQNTGNVQHTPTSQNRGVNENVSVNLPGFDVDAGLNLGFDKPEQPGKPTPPTGPQTIKDVLQKYQNEQVEVTTPFGPITGTVISVQNDYVVLVESDGSTVQVPINKIEQVNPQ